ncbi:MAG: bifunctional metallophosphatase/5'-nucleotidase, partial [Actinomycetota bacterium]|nr:bifunctional metallophosphatase/5'-nucleotidase [Actinomycetota bacterium]
APDALGRLKTTTTSPTNVDGEVTQILSYGGRSFSILGRGGGLLFDSGSQLEELTAAAFPEDFNSNNDENNSFDNRSDDKGPEPEGVDTGRIAGSMHAFIGLERISAVAIYGVSDPRNPVFVMFLHNRDFSGDPTTDGAGDLGPEGIVFIPGRTSPNGKPMLAVANEVSGSTTLYDLSGL